MFTFEYVNGPPAPYMFRIAPKFCGFLTKHIILMLYFINFFFNKKGFFITMYDLKRWKLIEHPSNKYSYMNFYSF